MIRILPEDFGDGTMSANAADLIRLMVAFTDIDAGRLVQTIFRIQRGRGRVNTATVERAISILQKA